MTHDFDELRKFADDEQRPEFPRVRLVPLRVYLQGLAGLTFVDLMAPRDANGAEVTAQAIRELPPGMGDGRWQLDHIELGHERARPAP